MRRKMDILFILTFIFLLLSVAYAFQQTSNHLYRQQQIRIQQDDMRALERQGYVVDIHKKQIKAMKQEDTYYSGTAQKVYIRIGIIFVLWSLGCFIFIQYIKYRGD